ncbi:MAG: hypothetical protein N2C14_33440, partial [Planctomycetales bacterium]
KARAARITELDTNVNTALAANNRKVQDAQRQANEAQAAAQTREAQVRRLSKELTSYTPQKTDVADGEIRKVDQRSKIVYINIGRSDHLPSTLSFSIYPPDKRDFTDSSDRKGSIEVTEIVGEHLAKARIIDQDVRDVLLPGDKIYSPTWNPGRREHFALSGILDIDKDGRADNAVVKNLIRVAGGIVDAEVTTSGQLVGKITPSTRILVEGKRPIDVGGEGSETMSRVSAATNDLRKQADKNGVRIMSMDAFLDHVGYRKVGQVFRSGGEYNLKGGRPPAGNPSASGRYCTRRRPPTKGAY